MLHPSAQYLCRRPRSRRHVAHTLQCRENWPASAQPCLAASSAVVYCARLATLAALGVTAGLAVI
jgi:hypothetical protein